MTAADFQPLIDWLKLNPNWLLFSIFLISLIESLAVAGIIVPGVLLLFLVASAAGHLDVVLTHILIVGFLGAIAGDGISFYLGRYFKDSIPNLWPFSRYPDMLTAGQNFFYKHGGKSVMLGRFIGPVRPVLPLIAGMLGMSQLRFAAFNAASAVIWAPFYLVPGYLTGQAATWHFPENSLLVLSVVVSLLLLSTWLFRYLNLKLQKHSTFYNSLARQPDADSFWFDLYGRIKTLTRKYPDFEFPLASLTLFLFSGMLFIIWSLLITQTSLLLSFDQTTLNWVYSIRVNLGVISEATTLISVCLTLLGDELFLYVSFIILICLTLARKHYFATLHIIAAGILTALITHGLKQYFAIERPDITITPPGSLSYPSGHSSGATVLYGLVASFIAQEMHYHQRWKCYLIACLPITFIAFSRVILGVHWFSDIIGGISLGLIITSLTRISYSFFKDRDFLQTPARQRDRFYILTGIAIWLTCAVAYQYWYLENTLSAVQLVTR